MPQDFAEFLRTLFFDRTPPVALLKLVRMVTIERNIKKIGKDE